MTISRLLARAVVRYTVSAVFGLAGAALLAYGAGQLAHGGTASAASRYYVEPAACSACPAGMRITSAEVQGRQRSKLFIFKGTWPSSPDAIPTDLRLTANQLDVQIHPSAAGFTLVSGTVAGRPVAATDVAVGLRPAALLINVKDPLVSAPISFQFGLWKDGAYVGRIPLAGSLAWTGVGAPSLARAAQNASPSPSSSLPAVDVIAGAGTCTAIASGSVAGILAPEKVAAGTAPDPRSKVPTRFVGVNFVKSGIGDQLHSQGPFSVTAVLLRAGATAVTGSRPIDRMGNAQLWAYWDGSRMHKGLRTWDGRAWSMLVETEANALTLEVRTAGLAFYWGGIEAGDHLGFLVTSAGGCVPLYLTSSGAPQVTLR